MLVVICPGCGMRVVPYQNGICPSCHRAIEGLASSGEGTPERIAAPISQETVDQHGCIDSDDLEQLRREYDCRRRKGKRLRSQGRALVGLAFLVSLVCSPLFPLNWLAIIPIAISARKAYSEARKLLMPHARLLLERDKRLPVLYLRSFRGDGSYAGNPLLELVAKISPLSAVSRRHTYEEKLVESAKCVGPVIAVGRSGEPLPELGAARLYLADSEWMVKVRELMKMSRLVILRTGMSPGLLWEITTAADVVAPQNLILYVEPAGAFSQELQARLPVVVPLAASKARFVYFDADWTPHSARTLNTILKRKGIYRVQAKTIILLTAIAVLCGFLTWLLATGLR